MSGATESLLKEVEKYCRAAGLAESTFGRQAVNDGKLCARLRAGKNVTLETAQRIRDYIDRQSNAGETEIAQAEAAADQAKTRGGSMTHVTDDRPFRFYDNRQKYLAFVNTCNEKWKVAERATQELTHIRPSPPALRLFDAGVTLEKLPDRFIEHPSSVIIMTNLYYAEAPWLMPNDVAKAAALNWIEMPLQGASAHEFGEQLRGIDKELVDGWQVKANETTGNPMYVRPSVLVMFREDHRFLLDDVIPKRGQAAGGDYDLVLASQPWRARMDADFKVKHVLAPLAKSLRAGGRLLTAQSCGDDPGLELVRKIWPEEDPFQVDRHELIKVLKEYLGRAAQNYNFNAGSDAKSVFQYQMHTLPTEIGESIGTSTLFAAWNAAIYVGQIEDERLEPVISSGEYLDLEPVISSGEYLDATADVLHKHNGIWFNDETFVVSRKRDT
jgi:hypothetical protein